MDLSANDIIKKALLRSRIIYPGESVNPAYNSQVKDELDMMLEMWSTNSIIVMADVFENFTLTAGTAEYTYGTGKDFNSASPQTIHDSTYIKHGDLDYWCRIIPIDQYRKVRLKSVSSRPRRMTYQKEPALCRLFFFPTPDSNYSIYFRVSKELTSFSDNTTKVTLANGVAKAIISNLALVTSTIWGKKILPELKNEANDSLKALKSNNMIVKKKLRSTPHLTGMSVGNDFRGGHGRNIIEGPFE